MHTQMVSSVKHKQMSDSNMHRELPEADWGILFLSQPWEVFEPSLVRYLGNPHVCVCVSIVSACISLNTSHTSHSLPPNGIIHCSLILLVWNLHRRESFSLSPSALRLWSGWGKLIIDFIKQWGCWPLGAENERLEGTLPEWIHFLHNPLQSSSSHHCATGGAGVTH